MEVLASGGPTSGSLDAIEQAVARCPRAEISSPTVADLGDGAAALRFTTEVAQLDGSRLSIPALVGVVLDGERLVTLASLSQNIAPDAEAFAGLLQQAYEVQSEALG